LTKSTGFFSPVTMQGNRKITMEN